MRLSEPAITSDGHTFQIQWVWKEEVVYWEGAQGFLFDAGWGVEPPVLHIPSTSMCDEVVPEWMQGRRSAIVSALEAKSMHVLAEDIHGDYRESPESRVVEGGPT